MMLLVGTHSALAQTAAYQETVLTSDRSGAHHTSSTLLNPWGIAFLPGGNVFIAENAIGRVDAYDADGNLVGGVTIPAPSGSAAVFSKPTGIAAVVEADFGPSGSNLQLLVAADNGTIWGLSTNDNGAPQSPTRFVDNSSAGARYTGLAILRPSCCGAFVAVANFGQGSVDTFTRLGDPLSLSPLTANPFMDPDLPSGFAPFNIQRSGDLVVVTYAAKDSSGNPVTADGSGIVNLFDQVGNFVTRFVSPGGALSAPWGIARASANFGPFSNDILISNAGGNQTINAFDPGSGTFLGQLKDGTGTPLVFAGSRALAVRTDGVGDPNAVYHVYGAAEGTAPVGTLGTITTGNAAFIGLTFFDTTLRGSVLPGDPVTLTAGIVAPSGVPSGTVTFFDTCCTFTPPVTLTTLGAVSIVNGTASVTVPFVAGNHVITATYSGDANFVSGSRSAPLGVLFETRTSLNTPSSVAFGMPVVLTANVTSIPPVQGTSISGQVAFSDGSVILGTADLKAGVATLTASLLASGTHSIVAAYSGSRFFQAAQSAPALVIIANPVPSITSLAPFSEQQNSGAFTLTVHGLNFVNGAVVTFNGASRPTQFVSATEVKASVTGSDVAVVGTANIVVANPTPGGGNSGTAMFAIDTATATVVTLGSTNVTVVAGQRATVSAQVSGFTGAVTATCLNAPVGVTCEVDSATNGVTIKTTAATPKGAHVITVVFGGQTLARNLSSATVLASLGIFGLPLGSVITDRRRRRRLNIVHCTVLAAALGLMIIGLSGCGSYQSKPSNPLPQTHNAQSSAALTLTVQ